MNMRAETSKGIVCGGPLAVRRSLTCSECHKVFKSRGNLIWHAEACLMEAFENEVYTVNSDRISKLYIPPLKTPISNTSGISVKSTDDNTRHERIQVKIGDNSPSKPGTSSESADKEASSPKRIEGPGGITLMVSVEKNSADELDEPPILDAQDLTMEPFEESLDDRDEEELELTTLHLNKMRSTTNYNTHVIGALANATDDGYKPKMECPTCGIVLYRHNFAAHYRIHTGELPFHCSFCGKRFRTTSQLKVHIRAHTGEKPYACKRCEYATITKRNLDRHTLIHHVHMPKVKGPIARKGRTITKYQDRPPELLDESDWPGVNDLNQSFEDDHKYLQEGIPEDDLMEEVEEEHITDHQDYQDLEDL